MNLFQIDPNIYLCPNCLYNDFDEYIFPNLRLTELIKQYPYINDFNFFCHWGSIGNRGLVSYSNAKEAFFQPNIK